MKIILKNTRAQIISKVTDVRKEIWNDIVNNQIHTNIWHNMNIGIFYPMYKNVKDIPESINVIIKNKIS